MESWHVLTFECLWFSLLWWFYKWKLWLTKHSAPAHTHKGSNLKAPHLLTVLKGMRIINYPITECLTQHWGVSCGCEKKKLSASHWHRKYHVLVLVFIVARSQNHSVVVVSNILWVHSWWVLEPLQLVLFNMEELVTETSPDSSLR